MAAIGESSSAPPNEADAKPVVVRVKRKASQSPLDAFWLEINERPLKRALLDFGNLSMGSSSKKELKSKKVFVQHVETSSSNEVTVDIVQSVVELNSAEISESKTNSEKRKRIFKGGNESQKHDQMRSKARQNQEAVARNARFEQIWRSRKETEEPMNGTLQDMCYFYDVVRVDDDERANEAKRYKEALEERRILDSYLPLLREFIPGAAEDIESDLRDYKVEEDEYVYDYYTVKEEVDETIDTSNPFPLVQVDEDDFYDGPDYSDYESDDSNAEGNPMNDYPEESEEESESDDSREESEDETDSDGTSQHERLLQDCVSEYEARMFETEFFDKYGSEGELEPYELSGVDSDDVDEDDNDNEI